MRQASSVGALALLMYIEMASFVSESYGMNYMPSGIGPKDHLFSELLLRDLVDRLDKEFLTDDTYIDPLNDVPSQLALMSRASKDLEGERYDYDAMLDGNPNPSLRDREYMQHSSLWGHQIVSGGAGEGPHRIKPQIKTDASLPAYCNPPNPCPVGFDEEQGCQMDFENTAAFSREYQASQECMCDGEHMFDCQNANANEDADLESFLSRQFHTGEHKNMVAKKFHLEKPSENVNPFLQGDKLPIAAKKGTNVY